MKIIIQAKPGNAMRYPTLGDWYVDQNGDLIVKSVGVNPLADDDAFLVALHELIEAKLCHKAAHPGRRGR